MDGEKTPKPSSYAVGPDHVTRTADRLIVHAAHDRLDWRVVQYRKPMILHAGEQWDLVDVRPGHGDTVRFDFVPWGEQRTDLPGRVIAYDEESVAAETAGRREERSSAAQGWLLMPLAPILGLLPSRLQRAAAERAGCSPATLTRASLVPEYVGPLLFAIVALIFGMPVAAFLGVPFFLDAAVRWSRLSEQPDEPLGAFEWLSVEQRRRRRGGRLGAAEYTKREPPSPGGDESDSNA